MTRSKPANLDVASRSVTGIVVAAVAFSTVARAADQLPPMIEIQVDSSIDGAKQPCLIWAPITADQQPTPLLIWLHSWSFDYRQKDALAYQAQVMKRGWILLLPNFRGRNDDPEAGGSELARADILDSLDYVAERFHVDTNRIYLAGGSGGGHMALLMAGYHPQRFSAVSAWVPIVDLADWYRYHARPRGAERYAKGVLAICGGPPGASAAVDAEYRARSPIFHLRDLEGLNVDIAAGIRDTAVPIEHSLRAYNVVAQSAGGQQVTDAEMDQLRLRGKLDRPHETDQVNDDAYGCAILLRRHAGAARVTIFQGGHVALPEACCAWLARQRRETRSNSAK